MTVFDQPEQHAAYLQWLTEHPTGYVLNTWRSPTSGWSTLQEYLTSERVQKDQLQTPGREKLDD